jgi:hypothetical protein
LFIEEKFVISNVVPGTVLAVNSLGELYQDILPVVTSTTQPVSNVLFMSPPEFRYTTLNQILDHIDAAVTYLEPNGRLIVNINLFYLIYDRLNVSLDSYCNQLLSKILKMGFTLHSKWLNRDVVTDGYGHLYLCFNRDQ